MKYVRIVLGALVAIYSAMGLWHMAVTVTHKTGVFTPGDAMTQRVIPLMDAMAWWQVGLWLIAMAFLVVAAWRLIRGGKAVVPYVVGLVLDVAGWLTVQDAYQTIFTAAERQLDYYMLGAMVVIAAIIWWSERHKAPMAAAA